MNDIATHECRKCGPKSIHFFAPNQLKQKTSLCMKCVYDANKKKRITNFTPAVAEGYGFRRTVFPEKVK